jgi:hypothetical protein
LAGAATAAAQEPEASDEEAAARAQANNPLADITAFNIQNYWVPKLYGIDDEAANTFWARLAVPAGPVLWRLSIPLPTVPTPSGAPEAGLGDMQLFASSRIRSRYWAVNRRRFGFANTSGSGRCAGTLASTLAASSLRSSASSVGAANPVKIIASIPTAIGSHLLPPYSNSMRCWCLTYVGREGVLRQVHLAHAASAELLGDFVGA